MMGESDTKSILLTDREIHSNSLSQREDAARDVLAMVGAALEKADEVIDDLERDKMLGPTIRRCCTDLADMAAQVAADIKHRSDDDRRELARACLRDARDARNELLLTDEGGKSAGAGTGTGATATSVAESPSDVATRTAAEAMAELSEEDVFDAINTAETILLDVEDALRSIGEDEADEIAEVGLTVARMFVWSLQSMYGNVTPQILAGTSLERGEVENPAIEILDDGNGGDGREISDRTASQSPNDGSGSQSTSGLPGKRMRVLWPPLGPAVESAGRWGADAASKNPILSVALGMALWPAAIIGAFVGAPMLAADYALQKGYDAAKDGPIVEAAEKGAANLYQVGKLSYLCARLVVRKGWRVGQRQVERRGGFGAVAHEVGSFAVDRALHPVETAAMAWDGLMWGAGTVCDAGAFVKSVATGEVTVGGVPSQLH